MKVIPPEEIHYPPQADGRNKVMSDHDMWLELVQEEPLEPLTPLTVSRLQFVHLTSTYL